MAESTLTSAPLSSDIRAFRSTIAPDLYSPDTFVPWDAIDAELAWLYPGIAALQQLVDAEDQRRVSLAAALLAEPRLHVLLQRLFVAPLGTGFSDGREFPREPPTNVREARRVAHLLEDLGIWRLLPKNARVEDIARVAEIAADSRRRGYRRTGTIQGELRRLMDVAIHEVQARGIALRLLRPSEFPSPARGRATFVVAVDERPVAAITAVFQAATGGRQQRDLLVTYPRLQSDLDTVPMHLILIADGRGLAETPGRILASLFESVASCMTTRQAEAGALAEALIAAANSGGFRGRSTAPYDLLIESSLRRGGPVFAGELPGALDTARLAIARYVSDHPELALEISPTGDRLSWVRSAEALAADELAASFEPASAISLLRNLLGGIAVMPLEEDQGRATAVLHFSQDDMLPEAMVVRATETNVDGEALREVATTSLVEASDSKLAAFVAPGRDASFDLVTQRRVQSLLPVNVVVLETSDLQRLTQGRVEPRDAFAELIVAQSDLTKASPFILSSATPRRMFYGREAEEAALIATIASNSVAVLGSRKIGKTSLLRHVESQLRVTGFSPHFMDCQTVRTWQDLGDLAGSKWGVRVPNEFKPRHLFDMVQMLARREAGAIVFLLDEIDQLLDWDQNHSEEEVPEAFFRACRTLSQEAAAQFVFSGERTIASKLWDAQSPHWNFCRPLSLQQLTKDATGQLLLRPLESLQISLVEAQEVQDLLWEVTSGHPQLVQLIGDSLVRRLNDREGAARTQISIHDLESVVDTFEFRETYLETYWGQATALERLLSLWIAAGETSPAALRSKAQARGLTVTASQVSTALRILTLYGIAVSDKGGYRLRASWFPNALEAYGGVDELVPQLAGQI